MRSIHFQVSFAKQKKNSTRYVHKKLVCASFINVSLMKVTYGYEQIFHHILHIYHQI